MLSLLFGAFSNLVSVFLSVCTGQNFPPPLSREEEARLFAEYANGDMKAREKLIEHNLRLVSHIVRKYYSASTCQDDLFSIGAIGLIKAIDSFNTKNGARFATYSAKCIQNATLTRMGF